MNYEAFAFFLMATITFFADHSEEPVLWVPPQSGAYTVEVGEGVRVVRSRTVKNAVEGALLHIPFVFILVVAILVVLGALLPSIGDEPGVFWSFDSQNSKESP